MSVTLTDNLVKRLKALQEKQSNPDLMLRVAVEGGGCQGFEYKLDLISESTDEDQIFTKDGVSVVIDPTSLPFLENAEIDFTDELIGAQFRVKNPNTTSSCGCGTSFSL
ncbi:MAG: iron-sulfur cluster insertion protein ErpA [Alphaproteobacteria bacterium]|nr:iron-sulfur cluster insertion protein ErpA [Alphaproteobacteria bacterium]